MARTWKPKTQSPPVAKSKAKPTRAGSLAGLKKATPSTERSSSLAGLRRAAPASSPTTPKTPSTKPSSGRSTTQLMKRQNLPPRDDQIIIRQPWAGKAVTSVMHVKRAKRLKLQYPLGCSVVVSWLWDASSAFSTRPEATDDSFGGVIEKYDEMGQMHLKNERSVVFVIPCAHITNIRTS